MKRILIIALLLGCKPETARIEPAPTAAPTAVHETPAGGAGAAGGMGAAPAPAAAVGDIAGEVLEVIPAGRYVYLRLKRDGAGEEWAAVLEAPVKVGDHVTVIGSMEMKNFDSPTLKRNFPAIWFGTLGATKPGDGAAAAPAAPADPAAGTDPAAALPPAAAPAAGAAPAAPAAGTDPAAAPAPVAGDPAVVAPTPIPVGAPAAEATAKEVVAPAAGVIACSALRKDRVAQGGKTVTIRGKVTKYNEGILGKNWLHVVDGSATDGSDDIAVVTLGTATVGTTVSVTGTVAVDKDYGAGYKYDVLVDDATVKAE
jgi:hypothetical protein